jgi:mono/diheme cytochrome c family protein
MRALPIACLYILSCSPLAAKVDFIRDVKPILEDNCVRCHDANSVMRGVRLDRKDRAMMQIVKKRPDDSPLYNISKARIMPPGGKKLSPADIETLRKWIAEGARWPDGTELVGTNRIK